MNESFALPFETEDAVEDAQAFKHETIKKEPYSTELK